MNWKKFTASNSRPTAVTYPDLPDDITWFRLVLGIIYGITLGCREISGENMKGSVGVLFGLNVIIFIPVLYLNFFLNANTDTYKNLNFAGVSNSLALLLLIWTIVFTYLHENELQQLSDMTTKILLNTGVNTGEETGGVALENEREF
eukprot:CAMPEP_0184866996 /NCGR_PEP_ID=MMETSP0580-20130426/24631_1 /TAXON_ID=1118495 /ORGANISM="Dactyliosolen fragilissimus" /LENGTH=146 /DNA_ID=CAMNT_0027366979 /DNA_START=58 /DNA_END=498 /DNA_ORIENTATION=-